MHGCLSSVSHWFVCIGIDKCRQHKQRSSIIMGNTGSTPKNKTGKKVVAQVRYAPPLQASRLYADKILICSCCVCDEITIQWLIVHIILCIHTLMYHSYPYSFFNLSETRKCTKDKQWVWHIIDTILYMELYLLTFCCINAIIAVLSLTEHGLEEIPEQVFQ